MQGFEFNTVRRIINGSGSAWQLANQCRAWVSAGRCWSPIRA